MRFLLYASYVGLLLSIALGARSVTSVGTPLLFILATGSSIARRQSLFYHTPVNVFLAGCVGLVLLHALAILYTTDTAEGIRQLMGKTSLLFIPFAMMQRGFLNAKRVRLILSLFTAGLVLAMCWCLFRATQYHLNGASLTDTFFYHRLVQPFRGHAIMWSILVFLSIMHVTNELTTANLKRRILLGLLMIFLLIYLVLLSSKLVIVFSLAWLVVFMFLFFRNRHFPKLALLIPPVAFVLVVGIVLLTRNPVSQRFREIVEGNTKIISQSKFGQGTYLNGLQFRLLEWRFTGEILHEQHAWLGGVTPGDAQHFLDKKYLDADMYHGTEVRHDNGFIGYNTHNEFLQSLLQCGVGGLACFLLMCVGLVRLCWQRKDVYLWGMVALLILYSFNEAVLQTQFGLLLFTLVPLLFYYRSLDLQEGINRGSVSTNDNQ